MADLSCGTLTGVVMQRGAALDLNGHAIVTFGAAVHADFDRSGRISVKGPGQISGCDIAIATSGGIDDRRRVIASNLDVVGCTIGIAGSSVRVDDVSVTGSLAAGIYADFGVIGKNVVASNNGTFGVVVPYGPVRIRNLTANGNGWQGVLAAKASLRDSTVTGNDVANGIDIGTTHRPSLKAVTCGLSAHEPFLAHVAGPPWGVCAND